MDYRGFYTILVIWFLPLFICHANDVDSIGVETRDNQIFVLHRVEAGETLYSLSRRYGANIASIVENNQISANNLTVGEILRIPWPGALTHQVKTSETLYSISKLYGISVTDLKALNRLKGNELEIGKVLIVYDNSAVASSSNVYRDDASMHIVGAQETLYSLSRKYDVSMDDIRQWNKLTDNNVRIGDTLWLKIPEKSMVEAIEQNSTENESNGPEIIAANVSSAVSQKNLTAVTELGIAAVIDGASDTQKYLALHPTAPVGTIMRVRNEMTNLSVFVRVVGKLPATGANNNVLIRLSTAAQAALGALDEKFRVEVSYVPSQ